MIFWTKDRCYNGGKQHNFKARVTENFTPQGLRLGSFSCTEETMKELCQRGTREQTYHGDVCTWCGQVANKP